MPKERYLILLIWQSLLFSVYVEKSERVDFKSANPVSFYHIVTELEEQISVTTASMILDAYLALDALVSDARIDTGKVAITGWSLGGGVPLFSAWEPLYL